jgi:hypothetical protein
MNAFPFGLVRAIFRSVVEAGIISVAGLALILQYGYRALQVATLTGNEFLDRVFPVTEKFREQQSPTATRTSRSGRAIEAHGTGCIRPVFLFAVAERLYTSKGKGKT